VGGDGISTYTVEPEDFGLPRADPEDISGGDGEESARIMLRVLKGVEGPRRDITLLNAAAAIFLSGEAESLKEGLRFAERSVDSGRAREKLEELVEATDGDLERLEELEGSL